MKAEYKSKLNLEQRVALQDVIPLQTPFLLYVDPSSACNFRCQFCPTGHKDLVKSSDYQRSVMDFAIFQNLIDGLSEFDQPLKVMRFNKIGEPLLNKNLVDMVSLAKNSGLVKYVDLATNGYLLSKELLTGLVDAGLDRLNLSLEGVNKEQYLEHAKVEVDFGRYVEMIRWFYDRRGGCEFTIKIPGNYLDEEQKAYFFETFGDYCDRIFIEGIAPIWPGFDIEKRSGIGINGNVGQYQQFLQEKEVCTYIFYAMAVNADGTVSACCPDWAQKLIVGDLRSSSIKEIWNSAEMNELRQLHLQAKRKDNEVCRDCGHIKHSQVDNIDAFKNELLERMDKELAESTHC
jgi:radical SAM protein with 4Fe4S-binding SPASM domain